MTLIFSVLVVGLTSWGLTSWLPALPWYLPFIIALLAGMALGASKANAFLAGFLGVGLFWCLATLLPHFHNDGILTSRIAEMFAGEMNLPVTPIILLIVTPLFGGLIGGAVALSGKYLAMPGKRYNRHSEMHKRNRRRGSYKLKLN
ncbi:MAG: hypothetical protein GY751_00905 [Bacteroidetes bacterium]|nr:hypothetical protein [Bacteroidota bacterium]